MAPFLLISTTTNVTLDIAKCPIADWNHPQLRTGTMILWHSIVKHPQDLWQSYMQSQACRCRNDCHKERCLHPGSPRWGTIGRHNGGGVRAGKSQRESEDRKGTRWHGQSLYYGARAGTGKTRFGKQACMDSGNKPYYFLDHCVYTLSPATWFRGNEGRGIVV